MWQSCVLYDTFVTNAAMAVRRGSEDGCKLLLQLDMRKNVTSWQKYSNVALSQSSNVRITRSSIKLHDTLDEA